MKEKREGKVSLPIPKLMAQSAWYVHQNLLNPQQLVTTPTQTVILPPNTISPNIIYQPLSQSNMAQVIPHQMAPNPVPQSIIPQNHQPGLSFVPSPLPAHVTAPSSPAKQVHVLQIKRAPKPVAASPVKPIQAFFSNSTSTSNDTPTLPQTAPMAVEPKPEVSAGLAIDLNEVSTDNAME